jgi:uncharacterized peroxidase-related enzyme
MTEESPQSWYPLGDEQNLDEGMQVLYARCRAKLGFVPNVFQAYQWRPQRLRAWLDYFDSVMTPTETLPLVDRELIAVAVSMANGCSYCLVAHGYSVRKLLGDPVQGDLATLDYRRAGLDERRRAILDYAVRLTRDPGSCEHSAIADLQEHGLSLEDVWDVAEVASLFNLTNRMAHATGMLPNPEYHALAR